MVFPMLTNSTSIASIVVDNAYREGPTTYALGKIWEREKVRAPQATEGLPSCPLKRDDLGGMF